MSQSRSFPVAEIAGRLLHEEYLKQAQDLVTGMDWEEETIPSPAFPDHAETDTGTLRAVVVAS